MPQVSGKLLKVLAGDEPTRTNTVLLSTFLENQSPFVSFIIENPFRYLFNFVSKTPPIKQQECQP
jgi:hypothetical protein